MIFSNFWRTPEANQATNPFFQNSPNFPFKPTKPTFKNLQNFQEIFSPTKYLSGTLSSNHQKRELRMSHCLSNLSISNPVSSQRPLFNPRFSSHGSCPKIVVKATAGEGRDNLYHVMSTNKQQKQQQQQKPKERSARVAPIGLWDRFPTARTIEQMLETMDRMIEDPFSYSDVKRSPSSAAETVGYNRGRTPWEIVEGEKEYKMRFDMPGMTKEDVKVLVEDKMLVVKAEKQKSENDGEGGHNEWSARSYGRYSSRIALPENVEFEKIKAEVKDGVLYITIPKASSGGKVFDVHVE